MLFPYSPGREPNWSITLEPTRLNLFMSDKTSLFFFSILLFVVIELVISSVIHIIYQLTFSMMCGLGVDEGLQITGQNKNMEKKTLYTKRKPFVRTITRY